MPPMLRTLFDEHPLECKLPKFFVAPFVTRPLSVLRLNPLDVLIPGDRVGADCARPRTGLCRGRMFTPIGSSDPTPERLKHKILLHGPSLERDDFSSPRHAGYMGRGNAVPGVLRNERQQPLDRMQDGAVVG